MFGGLVMNDKEIEEMLKNLGNKITIDQEHKKGLRNTFEVSKINVTRNFMKYIAAACIVLLIFTVSFSLLFTPTSKVEADSLKVQNYMTYLGIDSKADLSIAEYRGVLYIPNINEGIYKFDGKTYQKIYSGRVSLVKISPEGKKLAFYEEGNIGILDLMTLKSEILLRSDSDIAYESPAWFDESTIIFTKRVIQDPTSSYYEFNIGEIFKLYLDNQKQTKIADGINATYIKSTDSLLYQKSENIVVLDLKTNVEKIIDKGEQPVASTDGKAIAYSKLHIVYENIDKNVVVERVLQNLWIADGISYARKTMITNNIVLEDINIDEWLKNLKPSDETQMLSLSGRYSYQFPTWSSDSKLVYAIRRDYSTKEAVVIKIELGKEELSAKTVVERFLQAIILKDEDYQNSLIAFEANSIDVLKENKLVSYRIIDQGEELKTDFIDVELNYIATNKDADNSTRVRFYLSRETGAYYIVDMKKLQ